MDDKNRLPYSLIGLGIGIIISGIIMVVISLGANQEYQEYNEVTQETPEIVMDEYVIKNDSELQVEDNITDEQKDILLEELPINEVADEAEDLLNNITDDNVAVVIDEDNKEVEELPIYMTVTIPTGYSATQIADFLAKEGVVDDSENFHSYIKSKDKTTRLLTGTKIFVMGSTYEDVLNVLLTK